MSHRRHGNGEQGRCLCHTVVMGMRSRGDVHVTPLSWEWGAGAMFMSHRCHGNGEQGRCLCHTVVMGMGSRGDIYVTP
eukprot:117888-Prorocentrum_minimum.AAC.1